jgi:phospholipid-binding lipoprotein MlaA
MIVLYRACAGALIALLLAGCATTGATTPGDPWERMNRGTYRFNDVIDRKLMRPVATGYRNHTPQFFQTGVDNFLTHLAFPTTIVNDLLQLKIRDTLIDLGRFAVNTTLGVGGLLDPASHFGIPRNDEDFGQTLGRWGVPSGPYLVLPLFGPSSARDGPSVYVDAQTDLRVTLDVDSTTTWTLVGLSFVNRRARYLPFDASLDAAYDRYAFIRDAWLQRREYQVRDGQVSGGEITPEELEELEREMEDPEGLDDPREPDVPVPPEVPEDQPSPAPADASSSDTSLMPASADMARGRFR